MSGLKCAYCDAPGSLTREHLWPAALHRRRVQADNDGRSLFWLRRIDTVISSEPTIRDVCATCNNVHLSALDDYITGLFDRAFIHIPVRYERVLFEYDYHLLKRWLLKLCFNSARVHGTGDLFALKPLRPYMLGHSIESGKSVQLYVQLVYPAEVPISDLQDPADAPVIYTPTDHRVGLRSRPISLLLRRRSVTVRNSESGGTSRRFDLAMIFAPRRRRHPFRGVVESQSSTGQGDHGPPC
jgi:hypothetical protein